MASIIGLWICVQNVEPLILEGAAPSILIYIVIIDDFNDSKKNLTNQSQNIDPEAICNPIGFEETSSPDLSRRYVSVCSLL